jgi:hypothetical protein
LSDTRSKFVVTEGETHGAPPSRSAGAVTRLT